MGKEIPIDGQLAVEDIRGVLSDMCIKLAYKGDVQLTYMLKNDSQFFTIFTADTQLNFISLHEAVAVFNKLAFADKKSH